MSINSGTGVITLDDHIHNTYLSTYPAYSPPSNDPGGPATIYACNPDWDMELTIRGAALHYVGSGVRIQNYIDCHFKSYFPPTTSRHIAFKNCTFDNVDSSPSGPVIFDKCIELVTLEGVRAHHFLSPGSNLNLVINNSKIDYLQGGFKHTTIRNSDIYRFAPFSGEYGAANSLTMSDSRIKVFDMGTGGADEFQPST